MKLGDSTASSFLPSSSRSSSTASEAEVHRGSWDLPLPVLLFRRKELKYTVFTGDHRRIHAAVFCPGVAMVFFVRPSFKTVSGSGWASSTSAQIIRKHGAVNLSGDSHHPYMHGRTSAYRRSVLLHRFWTRISNRCTNGSSARVSPPQTPSAGVTVTSFASLESLGNRTYGSPETGRHFPAPGPSS